MGTPQQMLTVVALLSTSVLLICWGLYRCPVVRAWLGRNKTKLTGYAGVLLGALSLNIDVVQNFIPADHRGVFLVIFGMVVAAIGHYNDSVTMPDKSP